MTQYNFTTNIEHRMPRTGKVYCIDRMTSDYAQAHPLDVDGFIESVYQEFAGTEFEESRETLKKLWVDVLSDTNPRGDASLYPNDNGARRAAAMKVWHKAGDFWRAKYRLGDTLLCDQNGAALNPMELGLIAKAKAEPKIIQTSEAANVAPDLKHLCNDAANDAAPAAAGDTNTKTNITTDQGNASREARKPILEKPKQLELFEEEEEESAGRKLMRSAGYLAAATLAIVIVWQTGLIIPLGLIGLGASGLLR
jgi:hypothetical protein